MKTLAEEFMQNNMNSLCMKEIIFKDITSFNATNIHSINTRKFMGNSEMQSENTGTSTTG